MPIIGSVKVFTDRDGNLIIIKSKRKKLKEIFLIALIPFMVVVFISIGIYYRFQVHLTVFTASLAGILILYCTLSYINVLLKTISNIRDLKICIKNGFVYINKNSFCSIDELEFIILQPVPGSSNFGISYTIGLKSKHKSTPLTYFHGKEDSRIIAETISSYLKRPLLLKKPFLYSFFKKW